MHSSLSEYSGLRRRAAVHDKSGAPSSDVEAGGCLAGKGYFGKSDFTNLHKPRNGFSRDSTTPRADHAARLALQATHPVIPHAPVTVGFVFY
jgi:hypothetical protein